MPITPETELRERGWHVVCDDHELDIHPGVAVPVAVQAHGPLSQIPGVSGAGASTLDGFRLEAEAVFEDSQGLYLLRRCSLVAPDGAEVTGQLLRSVAPLSVLRWILPRTFRLTEQALTNAVVDFIAPELKQFRIEQRGHNASGIELTDVGTVYKLAGAVRYPPARAVAETFNLQPRTATNWITRARAAGLT